MRNEDTETRGFGALKECWRDIRERRGPVADHMLEEPPASPPASGGISLTDDYIEDMTRSWQEGGLPRGRVNPTPPDHAPEPHST